MPRRRRESRAALRRRAPKPPTGAVLAYRAALRRALKAQQARLWAIIESSYVEPKERADWALAELMWSLRRDAAADGDGSLRAVHVELPAAVLDLVGKRVAKKTALEAKRLVGITRASTGADQAMVDAFRKRNLGLIRTMEAKQVDDLGEVLKLATAHGWAMPELRKAVEERFGVAQSHADLIARDQTLKLNAQITQHRQTSAGISEYVWSTSNDERVRDEHAELDGTRHRWDDPPVATADGERGHPGELWQCRCVAVAVVPWLEEEA